MSLSTKDSRDIRTEDIRAYEKIVAALIAFEIVQSFKILPLSDSENPFDFEAPFRVKRYK